jgi:Fe-S cluster assembly scaffold protein SufB
MRINKSPILTSKNYQINDFFVPDEIFDKERKPFKFDSPDSSQSITLSQNNICEKTKEELENANAKSSYIFSDNNDENIDFNFDNANDYLVDVLNLTTSKNISKNLVINYKSKIKAYHNGYIHISLQENSILNLIVNIDMSKDSENFLLIESDVQKDASLNLIVVDFSGKYSICKIENVLSGENATSNLKSLCIGKDSNIDLNFIQTISAKNCTCDIDAMEALLGSSEKNFKGTIDFKQGAAKSKGNENEYCLLLSKESKSKAMPILLSKEEDVDGSHSSATGKIDEKEKFYLMSRGLDEKEALLLIVKAKFNKILNNIFDEKLKNEILENIDRIVKYE